MPNSLILTPFGAKDSEEDLAKPNDNRISTGAEYLARLALKARELSQGRASASQGQN